MNSSNCPCKTTVSTICCVIWSGICSVLLWQLSMVWGGRRGGGVCVWGESGGGCGGCWTGFWVAYNTEASFSTQARPHSSSTLCDHVSLTGNKPTKENKAKRREEKKKDTELKRPSLETWHTDTHIPPERLQFARGCSETRNQSLWHGPFHQQPPLSRPTEPNPWSTPRAQSNRRQPSEPALGTSPRDTSRGIWHLRLHRLWHTTDESNHGDGRRVTMALGGPRHIDSSLELNSGLGFFFLGGGGLGWREWLLHLPV